MIAHSMISKRSRTMRFLSLVEYVATICSQLDCVRTGFEQLWIARMAFARMQKSMNSVIMCNVFWTVLIGIASIASQ